MVELVYYFMLPVCITIKGDVLACKHGVICNEVTTKLRQHITLTSSMQWISPNKAWQKKLWEEITRIVYRAQQAASHTLLGLGMHIRCDCGRYSIR